MEAASELRRFIQSPNNPERVKTLQRNLFALHHASRCVKQTNSMCTLNVCPRWKVVFLHFRSCRFNNCTFDSCTSSKILVDHFESCKNAGCLFCFPMRRRKRKISTSVEIVNTQEGQYSSSNYTTCSTTKRLTTSNLTQYDQEYWRNQHNELEKTEAMLDCLFSILNPQSSTSSYTNFIEENELNDDQQTANIAEELYEKTERIQRELIVMQHVQRCVELDCSNRSRQYSGNVLCAVPHCSEMKRTLIHIALCQGSNECKLPQCEPTRTILDHWLSCQKYSCGLCLPVLRFIPALDGNKYDSGERLVSLLYASSPKTLTTSEILEECALYGDTSFSKHKLKLSNSTVKQSSNFESSSSNASTSSLAYQTKGVKRNKVNF